MGSKNKYAEDILISINREIVGFEAFSHVPYINWVEPFVGGANMIDKIPSSFKKIGNDINHHLICMFRELQNGWIPPVECDESTYKNMMELSKTSQPSDIVNATIGFIGIGCSYSGKWFGGYARGNQENGNPRNYCKESQKNLLKQKPYIKDVLFISGDYQDLPIPKKSIIYCDPPYQGTTKYKNNFDHNKFWKWCNEQILNGHKVFVSEYSAPEDWRCIWSKEVNNSLTKDTGSKKGIERLFTK